MMNRLVVIAMAGVISAASSAVMADGGKSGPAVIRFKMGNMTLDFQHEKHIKSVKNECFHCHTKENGKIEGWGEKTAHVVCIPCHDLNEKGPVLCHECHDKK